MKYSWLFILGFLFVACHESTARRPINKNKTSKHNYSVEINKALNSLEEKAINKYIAQDSLLNYQFSPYGFAYAKVKEGNDKVKSVQEGIVVDFTKTVYSLGNKLVYSTQREICKIGKSNEIKGIQEGLKLMGEDEEFKFIFTSFVAYGFEGDGGRVPANTPLVIKIKLLKINN